jgi:hypothetical protein
LIRRLFGAIEFPRLPLSIKNVPLRLVVLNSPVAGLIGQLHQIHSTSSPFVFCINSSTFYSSGATPRFVDCILGRNEWSFPEADPSRKPLLDLNSLIVELSFPDSNFHIGSFIESQDSARIHSKYFSPGARCFLTDFSLSSMPRPGFSGTLMFPFSMSGLDSPCAILSQSGMSDA